jgi:hypothetical protein
MEKCPTSERRIMAVLTRLAGDHTGVDSLFELGRVERTGARAAKLRRCTCG